MRFAIVLLLAAPWLGGQTLRIPSHVRLGEGFLPPKKAERGDVALRVLPSVRTDQRASAGRCGTIAVVPVNPDAMAPIPKIAPQAEPAPMPVLPGLPPCPPPER